MRNLKLNYNTLCVTKSEPEFPMKGSEITPLDFSKLRVEIKKLSWLNTSVGTHKLYLTYEYEQCKTMQDMKERVREKDPNANTEICFEIQTTALRSAFT